MSEIAEKIAREISDYVHGLSMGSQLATWDLKPVVAIIDRHLPAQPAAPPQQDVTKIASEFWHTGLEAGMKAAAALSPPADAEQRARANHCPTCGAFPVDIAAATAATPPAAIPTPVTDAELVEAQRLYELTTQGEWRYTGSEGWGELTAPPPYSADDPRITITLESSITKPNADWIVAAHRLWPKLIAAAEKADVNGDFAIHLGKRLQAVVLASRKLVERLHEIHANDDYQGVWAMAQIHQGPYQGPNYEAELKELESVLANSEAAAASSTVGEAELDAIEARLASIPEGPYFVDFDDGGDCPNHAKSGLAVVDTGRESEWPIARHCYWPVAKWIQAAREDIPRLIAALRQKEGK